MIAKRAGTEMRTHAVRLPAATPSRRWDWRSACGRRPQSPAGTWTLLLALMAAGMVLFRASRGKAGWKS